MLAQGCEWLLVPVVTGAAREVLPNIRAAHSVAAVNADITPVGGDTA